MKTSKLVLALAFTLMTSLCGCEDIDLSGFSAMSPGGYGSGNYDFDIPYEASFYIDSTTQASNSKLIVWAHIHYDSIMMIKNRQTKVGVGANLVVNTTLSQYSIDFRTLSDSDFHWSGRNEGIYKYNLEIENLKKNIDYLISISYDYEDRGKPKSVQQAIVVRLN